MKAILWPRGVKPQIIDMAAKIAREAGQLEGQALHSVCAKNLEQDIFAKNKLCFSMGCWQSRTDRHFPCRSVDRSHHFSMKLQHRCLQTSCWVEQLRLQAPVFAGAATPGVGTALGRQEFWQFIACVSQLI